MARSPEEGEVEQELEMKEREERRKSWKKIEDQRHEVKTEKGSVRIFLEGTSKPLLVYDSPPEPPTDFVHGELCIIQDCAGGVIRERETHRSLALQPSLGIGEYDFIPSRKSGYVDGDRLLHRMSPVLQRNSFLSCDAFIYNDIPPIRGESASVKRFKAELAIDMGCHMELVVPQRKARQLGLVKYGERVAQGFGGAQTVMQIYLPVLVCLLKEGRTFKRAVLEPSSRLKEEEDHLFAGFRDVHNVVDVKKYEVEIQSTEDQPTEALPVPLKVKQFSPYKNKASQVPDALLGLRGLEKLQLTIDFEKALLLPVCTAAYISTTIISEPLVTTPE